MYSLTDEQIEFILADIKARGVKIESLQLNLLDHICCIIERDPEAERDFEKVYNSTVKTFFKNDLEEIEKEALILLKFKHYYRMKRFLYLLLFLSLGYNIHVVSKITYSYFENKGIWSEHIIKDITIQEGSKEMFRRLKKEYPNGRVNKKVCVSFLYPGMLIEDSEADYSEIAEAMSITVDSFLVRDKYWKDRSYLQIDSLANVYRNITFVIAYQGTGGKIDRMVKKYKPKTKNIIFLPGMNKLYSGYENSRNNYKTHPKNVTVYPIRFVIDENGNLIYSDNRRWSKGFDKELIKTLAGK